MIRTLTSCLKFVYSRKCEKILVFCWVYFYKNSLLLFLFTSVKYFICNNKRKYWPLTIHYLRRKLKYAYIKVSLIYYSLSGLFGTSAPKPTVKTTIGATSAQGTKALVLDYFAHKLCPKHLQRNRYLMYYSYVKRCYTFVITDRADWFTAKADCASNGGNLMNIHQSLENFYLGMRDQIALGHADAYIWIGLSDTVTPGNFSWINGTGINYKLLWSI